MTMKGRKDTCQQDPDQAPVTFQDVAAYFYEEEWKLLHERQKELYRKTMKDIHRALMSLGYDIINTNIVLRIKKGGDTYIPDAQEPERRADLNNPNSSCYPDIHPDILFRIKQEDEPNCSYRYGSGENESKKIPSKGSHVPTTVCSLKMKDEEKLGIMDHQNLERRGSSHYSPRFPFLNSDDVLRKEDQSVASQSDHVGEKEENSIHSSSVVSFIIKEEEESCSLDHVDAERRESTEFPSLKTLNAQQSESCLFPYHESEERGSIINPNSSYATASNTLKDVSLVNSTERKSSCKSWLGTAKTKVLQGTDKGTNSRKQRSLNIDKDLEGENTTQWESVFMNTAHTNLQQEAISAQTSDPYDDWENYLSNARLLACQPNIQENWRQNTCPECGKSFHQKRGLIRHQKTHKGMRPYQCNECEKNFFRREHLLRHQRTHTGDKPYQCTECEKSFIQKAHLVIHQRKHTTISSMS